MTENMVLTGPDPAMRAAQVAAIVTFFGSFSPASLGRLSEIYAGNASFVDPFNEVSGIAAIRHVYADMYAQLADPRFEVLQSISEQGRCVLTWNLHFRRSGSEQAHCIHGASVLQLDEEGRIVTHRDYWDPSRQLYEHVPVLGILMRYIRRKLSAAR